MIALEEASMHWMKARRPRSCPGSAAKTKFAVDPAGGAW